MQHIDKVKDVVKVREEFAPLGIQERWDNSGLSIGSMESPVTSVLFGLDCTPALVDEAIACGADMIITHHPLIFGGLKQIHPEDPVGLAVIKAVQAGISVYAAHTTADKVIGGVSWAMAQRLHLQNVSILDEEADGHGLGMVGDLPEAVSADDFIGTVKKAFNLQAMRTSKPIEGQIRRVALCGGSGSSLIENARAAGAQAYISGDISYHHFFTTDDFMILDIGHYESEIEIVDILFSLIKKNFPTFAVRITTNIYSNPIFYF